MRKSGIAVFALAMLAALCACGGVSVEKGRAVQSGESAVESGANTETGTDIGTDTGTDGGTDGASDSVTMRDILAANRTEALTASRGSFLMETAYESEIDTTGLPIQIYANSDSVYMQTDSTQELYTDYGCYFFTDDYYGTLLVRDPVNLSSFSMVILDEETTVLEEITGVEQNGDTLTVHTILSADAIKEYYGDDLESYAYLEGDSTENVYVLDAADLAVLSCSTVLRHDDGTEQNVGIMEVSYGGTMPESGVILREHLDAPDRRTVKIVLDPGTEEETVFSVTAQRGDRVYPYLPEGYYVCYTDPACTREYEGETDLSADVTLYSRAMDLTDMLGHAEDAEHDHEEYDEADHDHGAYDEADHDHGAYDKADHDHGAYSEDENAESDKAEQEAEHR